MKNRKLEFEWNLFIGKGLKVRYLDANDLYVYEFGYIQPFDNGYIYSNEDEFMNEPKYNIPILKNPRNLSDEEWLYVFRGNKENSFLIHNTGDYVNLVDTGGNVWNFYHFESCRISYCRQEQLNRFYEFSHPQFDELLKNGLIEELK